MEHKVVAVDNGLTYVVVLDFVIRDGHLTVTVKKVVRVSSLNLQQEIHHEGV